MLEHPYCHQTITQAHPRGDRTVSEKVEFSKNFQMPLNGLNNSSFGAFGVPMAPATRAWRPLHGSLWVLKYPYCHQMTTQPLPRGDRRVSEKVKCSTIFSRHMLALHARGHMGGVGPELPSVRAWGGGKLACAHGGSRMSISQTPPPPLLQATAVTPPGRKPIFAIPWYPRHGLGGPYIKKKSARPRSKSTNSAHNTQRSFDPPPPRTPTPTPPPHTHPTPQKWGRGG